MNPQELIQIIELTKQNQEKINQLKEQQKEIQEFINVEEKEKVLRLREYLNLPTSVKVNTLFSPEGQLSGINLERKAKNFIITSYLKVEPNGEIKLPITSCAVDYMGNGGTTEHESIEDLADVFNKYS